VSLLSDDALAAQEKRQADRKAHPEIRPPAVSLAEQAVRRAERQLFAANTTAIQVYPHPNHSVILDTGSLGEAIKEFDQCSRDSLRDWGVDPDVEDKIVRPVWAPNPAAWFSPKDYPRNMLLNRKESVVKVRVLVDATGHVTKCTSLSHFNEPDFNKITCDRFTQRARFEPAELADGTKVPSYYVNNVVFRLAQ
jgi:outer membrane biosynthesis protein TonB